MIYVYDMSAVDDIFSYTDNGVLSVSELLEELDNLLMDDQIIACEGTMPVFMLESSMTDGDTAFYGNIPSKKEVRDALNADDDGEALEQLFEKYNTNFYSEYGDDAGGMFQIYNGFISDKDMIYELNQLDSDKLVSIGFLCELIGYDNRSREHDYWIGIDNHNKAYVLVEQDGAEERF